MKYIRKINWLQLATSKSWQNLLFLLLLWYAGIGIYILLNWRPFSSGISLSDRYIFYTQFSWPNFFLSYFIAIWIIPFAFNKGTPGKLILLTAAALAVFILVRYLNHLFWIKEYYVGYGPKNTKYQQSFFEITMIEAFRGIQFIFIAFSYRLLLDRTIMERKKRELEKAKLKSELATLRFQLNPHFLFNAFNSLYSMALRKSDSTPDALLKLSDMFRYVLQQNDEEVPIEKEVEHIERLISFEKIRFPESVILLHTDVIPSRKNLMVPPLLLATFVENAFKHGDPGTEQDPISIRLHVNEQKLSYTVINVVSISNPEQENKDSYGLSNLRKRLEILYPEQFLLESDRMENHFYAKLEIKLTP